MERLRSGGRTLLGRSLLAALLTVLCLSGILAWHAWSSARSHERVMKAALRDYAGFALWELRRRVEANASMTVNAALMSAIAGRQLVGADQGTGPLFRAGPMERSAPELATITTGTRIALGRCGCTDAASDYFLVHVESGMVEVQQPRLGEPFRDWLAASFLAHAGDPPEQTPAAAPGSEAEGRIVILRTQGTENLLAAEAPLRFDERSVVLYARLRRDDDRWVYGFVVDAPAFARALVSGALSGPPLLPPSLAGPVENDRALAVTAWTANRDTVFHAGVPAGSEFSAAAGDTLRLPTGLLHASVAVRPDIAHSLLIGGVPRSRFPLLAGTIGLTVILVLVAVVQLRRQQELFRLRADFVSGVSHELRTPLAQIRLFSDLLSSNRLDEPRRERSLRILNDEARRLTYLVDNVLRFSRSERRTERVTPVPTDVHTFLRTVVEDFQALADARDVRIVFRCPPDLRAPIDGDAMRQVMLNLLDNAVKYGPRGQTIHVTAARDADRVRIEVEDAGPGIPRASRERVWEPYWRLPRDAAGSTGGSGIGLAVVREVVKLHHGSAFVTDGTEGGSRFVLLLPGTEVASTTDASDAAVGIAPHLTPQPQGPTGT